MWREDQNQTLHSIGRLNNGNVRFSHRNHLQI